MESKFFVLTYKVKPSKEKFSSFSKIFRTWEEMNTAKHELKSLWAGNSFTVLFEGMADVS